MATLKTDFTEGMPLTAGVVSSTSSVNGITTTINSNTLTKMIYAGSDAAGSVHSGTAETTIATVTIPANTVYSGVIATAPISVGGSANAGTFKLKIGPTGSEAIKQTIILDTSSSTNQQAGSLGFVDTTQTWSAGVTVLVTGQNAKDGGATDICNCYQLIVTGF